jgi:hypothetical protein
MAIQADIAYQRSREDLLPYEDGRFNALFAAFANCYPLKSDYTIFAAFVRALARELARAEYQNSYSMVATDPNFLTPPDIKRQFADLLKINKSFPSASQDDQQYKQMLVDLAPAYNLGTVTAAIKAVIKAYTGEDVAVRELSQEVGTGVVQDYDRNYIQIALPGTLYRDRLGQTGPYRP